jgi:NitT/TauT family transport system permease protein
MRRGLDFLASVVLVALVLFGWEAAVSILQISSLILPAPSEILIALYRGFARGVYLRHLGITLTETLLGFIFGSIVGFLIGVAVSLNKRLEFFLLPYMVMFQSVPKVALAPLVIIWFGLGLQSKVIMAAMISFFPIMVNTIAGLKSVDEERTSLLAGLTASKWQMLRMLQLPSALPFIFAGL